MVAIVDADTFHRLATRQGPVDELFLSWIHRRHGMLAFSAVGQYHTEIQKNGAVRQLISEYERGGQLKKVSAGQVTVAQDQIAEKNLRSND